MTPSMLRALADVARTDAAHIHDDSDPIRDRNDERTGDESLYELADLLDARADALDDTCPELTGVRELLAAEVA